MAAVRLRRLLLVASLVALPIAAFAKEAPTVQSDLAMGEYIECFGQTGTELSCLMATRDLLVVSREAETHDVRCLAVLSAGWTDSRAAGISNDAGEFRSSAKIFDLAERTCPEQRFADHLKNGRAFLQKIQDAAHN